MQFKFNWKDKIKINKYRNIFDTYKFEKGGQKIWGKVVLDRELEDQENH